MDLQANLLELVDPTVGCLGNHNWSLFQKGCRIGVWPLVRLYLCWNDLSTHHKSGDALPQFFNIWILPALNVDKCFRLHFIPSNSFSSFSSVTSFVFLFALSTTMTKVFFTKAHWSQVLWWCHNFAEMTFPLIDAKLTFLKFQLQTNK